MDKIGKKCERSWCETLTRYKDSQNWPMLVRQIADSFLESQKEVIHSMQSIDAKTALFANLVATIVLSVMLLTALA